MHGMTTGATSGTPGTAERYWYDHDDDVVALLEAVRRMRRADWSMRRRTASRMAMNETDVHALQLLIAHELRAEPLGPARLARELGISTASTTKLLDRLEASGHVVRDPHPVDRRGVVLHATRHAHDEVRERLAHMHTRMAAAAAAVPPSARPHVVEFLDRLALVLDDEAGVAPLRPARDRSS